MAFVVINEENLSFSVYATLLHAVLTLTSKKHIKRSKLGVVLSVYSTWFFAVVAFGLFLLLLTSFASPREENESAEFSEAMAWNSERSVRECINRSQVSLLASCHRSLYNLLDSRL